MSDERIKLVLGEALVSSGPHLEATSLGNILNTLERVVFLPIDVQTVYFEARESPLCDNKLDL